MCNKQDIVRMLIIVKTFSNNYDYLLSFLSQARDLLHIAFSFKLCLRKHP